MTAGVPLGVTFSFLISAPMCNEIAIILLWELMGWKVATAYVGTGLLIAIVSGWVEPWVYSSDEGNKPWDGFLTWSDRLDWGRDSVKMIVAKVWKWVVLGIAVGALIHGYVPQDALAARMGRGAWWSVPLAVLIGVPLYSNATSFEASSTGSVCGRCGFRHCNCGVFIQRVILKALGGSMKRTFVGLGLCALLGSCHPTPKVEDQAAEVDAVAAKPPAFFTLKADVGADLKMYALSASELRKGETCPLANGVRYMLTEDPRIDRGHYKVTIKNPDFKCAFKTGHVYYKSVDMNFSTGPFDGSNICQKSWEEAPGTTDYVLVDPATKKRASKADRAEAQTLQGAKAYLGWNRGSDFICEKARIVKKCFTKAVVLSTEPSAVKFRTWAEAKGYDPALALMAKTQRETGMGVIPDSCRGINCNGIGIAQVITLIDDKGKDITTQIYSPLWAGITHNILTNLKYSVRVLSEKTKISKDLWELAFNYNGSPQWQRAYADEVESNYKKLKACDL